MFDIRNASPLLITLSPPPESLALVLIRSIGMRGTKAMLADHCNARTWQRIKKELEGLDITGRMKYAAMGNVQRCLEAFQPLRMRDYAVPKK